MNAISVGETYFWREIDQVRALTQTIVPHWFSAHPVGPFVYGVPRALPERSP